MSKIATSAEYLPPLPVKLRPNVFAELERSTGFKLNRHLRGRINEAATRFMEDLCRASAQPPAKDVRERLRKLVKFTTDFRRQVSRLMAEHDEIGDVMMSLLRSEMRRVVPKGRVSPEQLREQVDGLCIAASSLEANMAKTYGGKPGRRVDQPLNGLVCRLAEIHLAAGGRISDAYQEPQGMRNTPFLRLLKGVARSLRDDLPMGLADRERVDRSLYDAALEARVHQLQSIGLMPKHGRK